MVLVTSHEYFVRQVIVYSLFITVFFAVLFSCKDLNIQYRQPEGFLLVIFLDSSLFPCQQVEAGALDV